MARVRVVTRTIEDCVVDVTAMVIIDGKKSLAEKTLHLGGQVAEDKALSVAQKRYNKDDFKVVSIDKFYKETTIYGILESDFINLASPMDAERKFITKSGEVVSAGDSENDEPKEESTYEPKEEDKDNKKK